MKLFQNNGSQIIMIIAMVILLILMTIIVIPFGYSIYGPHSPWMSNMDFDFAIVCLPLLFCIFAFAMLFRGKKWARYLIGVYLLLVLLFVIFFTFLPRTYPLYPFNFFAIPLILFLALLLVHITFSEVKV